jgi:4-alpha-glucanotransferase
MPIYISLDSADAWANPELLQLDGDGRPTDVAGVPPDYFSEDGQLWGNPLYAWDAHAASGYRWWISRLQSSAELADIVRIDHFRGFEAYWSVPAEANTARRGAWVPGPGDAVFDAIESALGRLPIVAEDLGVITPEVEARHTRHGRPAVTRRSAGSTAAPMTSARPMKSIEPRPPCWNSRAGIPKPYTPT